MSRGGVWYRCQPSRGTAWSRAVAVSGISGAPLGAEPSRGSLCNGLIVHYGLNFGYLFSHVEIFRIMDY
jgi:hypothetical protein